MNAIAFKKAIALSFFTFTISCTATPEATTQAESPQQPPTQQQSIAIDGSSTVYPITDEVVQEFLFEREDETEPQISVAFSGTTGGFRKFCAGETDISDASRPITASEMETCRANGIQYIELPVAYDALTVVVNPDNSWAEEITAEELRKVWEPAAEGKITRWNQIRPSYPDQPINLYGAGGDSGTFDYFTEVIVGESGASRTDYTASEDDTELVQGVIKDPNALGYFGHAYYEENVTKLKALAVDRGNGPVLPSNEAVINAEYQPLARPLFIYVNRASLESKPVLQELVEYYLTKGENIVTTVGYVPLPDEGYALALERLQSKTVGTVFNGEIEQALTFEELLSKETKF